MTDDLRSMCPELKDQLSAALAKVAALEIELHNSGGNG